MSGKIWKPEGAVKSSVLPLEVATSDYWEESDDVDDLAVVDGKKRYFTWQEAVDIRAGDGWRLPTREEWAILYDEFGSGLADRLSLGLNGYIGYNELTGGVELGLKGYFGYFWSASIISIYNRSVYATAVSTVDASPGYKAEVSRKLSVRLVRDVK